MNQQLAASNQSLIEEALDYSLKIIGRNMQELDYFPERLEKGAWLTVQKDRMPSHWVDGFLSLIHI